MVNTSCNGAPTAKITFLLPANVPTNNDLFSSIGDAVVKARRVISSVADGRGSSLEIRRIIDMIDQERRNNAIRKCFYEQLGKGTPVMEAYSMTGKQFYLSEERVRQIVAKRKSR